MSIPIIMYISGSTPISSALFFFFLFSAHVNHKKNIFFFLVNRSVLSTLDKASPLLGTVVLVLPYLI